MATYTYREYGGYEEDFDADSWQEARTWATDKAREGDYGEVTETIWVDVYVSDWGDEEHLTVDIDPEAPDCIEGHDHEWEAPHHIVGGIESSPGVWGNGGGVIIKEVCMKCGCSKTVDTWAQNPSNGVQGLTSVSYEEDEYTEHLLPAAVQEAYGRLDSDACDTARRAAAHILAQIEENFDEPSCFDPELTGEQQDRVVSYGSERRAYRLALHMAAQNSNKRTVAQLVVDALKTPSTSAVAA